jgi:flagellar hook-length control protein FliK
MRIIDMVNNNFSEAVAKPQYSQGNSNAAFDMLFTEAGRRQQFDPTVENRNRDDNRGKNRANETKEQPRRRENNRAEETSSAGAAMVQGTSQNNEYATNTSNNTPVTAEDAIEKVEEIMEVSPEVVMEWLEELEMTAMDLADAQAVAKFLQLALDAENSAELLTNAKFPALYNAINEAMVDAEIKAGEFDEEMLNVLTEGLEVEVEDGKVVVTNSNANGSSANNQQASTHMETEDAEQSTELNPEVTDAKLIFADETTNNDTVAINPTASMEIATAKAEQAVRQAAPQQPVDTANVIEQIMNQVKIANSGGQFNEIRMTLRPETLGDIVLRVITQNGIVMAQFEAENQRVKEALEADFNLLRDALQEQGIKFSELSVSVRQDENERMNQFERERQKSRHRAERVNNVSVEEKKETSYHRGAIDITA